MLYSTVHHCTLVDVLLAVKGRKEGGGGTLPARSQLTVLGNLFHNLNGKILNTPPFLQ